MFLSIIIHQCRCNNVIWREVWVETTNIQSSNSTEIENVYSELFCTILTNKNVSMSISCYSSDDKICLMSDFKIPALEIIQTPTNPADYTLCKTRMNIGK